MIWSPFRANRIIAQLREENRLLRQAEETRIMRRRMRDDRRRARRIAADPILSSAVQNSGSCDECRGDCA